MNLQHHLVREILSTFYLASLAIAFHQLGIFLQKRGGAQTKAVDPMLAGVLSFALLALPSIYFGVPLIFSATAFFVLSIVKFLIGTGREIRNFPSVFERRRSSNLAPSNWLSLVNSVTLLVLLRLYIGRSGFQSLNNDIISYLVVGHDATFGARDFVLGSTGSFNHLITGDSVLIYPLMSLLYLAQRFTLGGELDQLAVASSITAFLLVLLFRQLVTYFLSTTFSRESDSNKVVQRSSSVAAIVGMTWVFSHPGTIYLVGAHFLSQIFGLCILLSLFALNNRSFQGDQHAEYSKVKFALLTCHWASIILLYPLLIAFGVLHLAILHRNTLKLNLLSIVASVVVTLPKLLQSWSILRIQMNAAENKIGWSLPPFRLSTLLGLQVPIAEPASDVLFVMSHWVAFVLIGWCALRTSRRYLSVKRSRRRLKIGLIEGNILTFIMPIILSMFVFEAGEYRQWKLLFTSSGILLGLIIFWIVMAEIRHEQSTLRSKKFLVAGLTATGLIKVIFLVTAWLPSLQQSMDRESFDELVLLSRSNDGDFFVDLGPFWLSMWAGSILSQEHNVWFGQPTYWGTGEQRYSNLLLSVPSGQKDFIFIGMGNPDTSLHPGALDVQAKLVCVNGTNLLAVDNRSGATLLKSGSYPGAVFFGLLKFDDEAKVWSDFTVLLEENLPPFESREIQLPIGTYRAGQSLVHWVGVGSTDTGISMADDESCS